MMEILGLLKTAAFLVLIVLSVGNFVAQGYAEVSAVEARQAMDAAEADLENAWVAVAGAEAAGANVSALRTVLVNAGNLLSTANASLAVGNLTGSEQLASLAERDLKGVQGNASALEIAARRDWQQRLVWTVAESSVSVGLAVIAVLLSWVFFKRYYVRRLLNTRPEVRGDETR